jgi:hypothetical protein
MSLYSSNLNSLTPGEYTQPYKHATKLFVSDTFRLAPKQSFLYYVVFEIDPSQTELGNGFLNNALEFADRYQRLENGLLVKDIELPKFSIGSKTLNAYNRKNIIQTNITYDPISVTFHDDSANVITNFWNDYYTYYFRDSDYTVSSYGVPSKYSRRNLSGWGYSPRNGSTATFLKSIRIFSLHNKNFTEYYLVNPIINSWRHGRHEAASNSGIMENTMTVSYETVKYFTGFINPVNVDGFSLLHYDNQKSPIAGEFLDDIGAIDALNIVNDIPKDLRKPDGTQGAGGPLSSLLTVFRTYQNLKNTDLKSAAAASITAVGTSVINDVINGSVSFPTNTTNTSRVANNSSVTNPSYAIGGLSDIVTLTGGIAAGKIIGTAINASKENTTKIASDYSRGIAEVASQVSDQWTRVYDVSGAENSIAINASSMRPPTGTYTAYVTDNNGNTINQFTVSGTDSKSYDPTNASLNLKYSQLATDASGNNVIVATYQDGTIVTFDEKTGDTLAVLSASDAIKQLGIPNLANFASQDTRTLVAQGRTVPSTIPQIITNPITNITTTVGGIATARIVDLGGVTDTVVGSKIGGTTGAVVGGLIGRALTQDAATRTGSEIGKSIAGGITPIVDKITGEIRQGIDNFSGAIKNVVGSWTGLGGYNASAPYDNLVSTTFDPNGGISYIYKNGDTLYKDASGSVIFNKGSNNSGLNEFFNNPFGKNVDVTGPSLGAEYGASVWVDSSGTPILNGSNEYIFGAGDINFQSPEVDSYSVLGFGVDSNSYESFYGGATGGIWSDTNIEGVEGFASGIDDGFDFDWLDF